MQKKIIKPAAILVLAGTIAVLSSGCYFFPDEEPLLEPPTLDVSEVVYYTYTVTRKERISGIGCSIGLLLFKIYRTAKKYLRKPRRLCRGGAVDRRNE